MSGGARERTAGRARLWVAWLWGALLAVLAAGGDLAGRALIAKADGRALLLLPSGQVSQARRQSLLDGLRVHPEIREARWLSPSDLAKGTAEALPRERWGELFSEEEAWLPWVVEARFRDTLLMRGAVASRVEALKAKGEWRLALFDLEGLDGERALFIRVVAIAAAGGLLAFALGIGALASLPRERGWLGEAAAGWIGASAAAAAIGGAAMAVGVAIDARAWGAGMAACFILAGLAAPVIKGRTMPPINATPPEEGKN